VEVRTRRLGSFVPAMFPSRAGTSRTEKECALAASGNGTGGPATACFNLECTAPITRNSRYTISCNGVLLLSLPLSPEPDEKVVMRPTGIITLQSAGCQTKRNRHSDSNFPHSLCSARFGHQGNSCSDTKRLGNVQFDRVMANDKAQNQNFRQLFVVAVAPRTDLPVVAGSTKAGT
jgi:hypothetical protein